MNSGGSVLLMVTKLSLSFLRPTIWNLRPKLCNKMPEKCFLADNITFECNSGKCIEFSQCHGMCI